MLEAEGERLRQWTASGNAERDHRETMVQQAVSWRSHSAGDWRAKLESVAAAGMFVAEKIR